jgi:hypothetical protein
MMALGAVLCSLLVLSSPVFGGSIPNQLGVEFGPDNVAVLAGDTTTLSCVTDGVANSNVRWYEYVTNPSGVLVSDGSTLLPSHPNYDRYELVLSDLRTFGLKINNINLNDAGYYQCQDSNAAPPSTTRLGAQLVVIEALPNCTRSYPADGFTIEGQYHTAECIIGYRASAGIAPLMTWSGPTPFEQGTLTTNTTVWAGISFYVDRNMAAQNWICKTNFTTSGFSAPDSATNAPTWQHLDPTNQIFVYWPPTNVVVTPIQASYEIGQTITCSADAYPEATFQWQSLRNSELWFSESFTIREDMVGYQLMRCTARNTIQGFDYTRDQFLDVYVNGPTTTPTTTVAPTTTTPPPWADCPDITGRWEAVNPNASVCITVDHTNNANLVGLYRNGSDTFWLQLTGKTREGKYGESGWAVIWPSTSVGVTSFAVECHSCYGVDQLLVNGVSRTRKDSSFCSSGGTVNDTPTYTFYRVPISWPCSASVATMETNVELADQGLLRA